MGGKSCYAEAHRSAQHTARLGLAESTSYMSSTSFKASSVPIRCRLHSPVRPKQESTDAVFPTNRN